MKKKRKPPVVFAEHEGVLYVKLEAIMHWMCAMADGLPITFFGKDRKTPYMTVDAAVEWCRKESTYHSKAMYDRMIDVMVSARDRLSKGEYVIDGDQLKLFAEEA